MTNEESTSTTGTAPVAEQGAQVAPVKASSKKGASQPKGTPKGKKGATGKAGAKPAAKRSAKPEHKATSKKASKAAAPKGPKPPREFSKKAIVLDLLRRKDGATMTEIAKATDWQNHSIRGFISGQLTKKMGLKVESTKNETGERVYRIASK